MIRISLVANDLPPAIPGYSLMELARTSCTAKHRTKGMDKMAVVAAALHARHERLHQPVGPMSPPKSVLGVTTKPKTFRAGPASATCRTSEPMSAWNLPPSRRWHRWNKVLNTSTRAIGDRGELIQLATHGPVLDHPVSHRQRRSRRLHAPPNKMGRAAIRTVGNLVYAVLSGNPTMVTARRCSTPITATC